MDADHVADELETVLLAEAAILDRVSARAGERATDYAGRAPVLVGVLGGADHHGRYRNLRCAAVLAPHAYDVAAR